MDKNLNSKINISAFDKIAKVFKSITKSSEKLQKSIFNTKKEVSNLKNVEKTINIYKELQRKYNSTSLSIAKLNDKVKKLGQDHNKSSNKIKKHLLVLNRYQNELIKSKNKQKSFKNELTRTSNKLKSAGHSTRNLRNECKKLTQQYSKANTKLEVYNRKLKKINKNQKKFRSAQKKIRALSSISSVGNSAYSGGKAMVGNLLKIIRPGINFEEQMSFVSAYTGISKTSDEFKKLKDLASELGRTTHFSAIEAAQGMKLLANAGFNASKIMESIPSMLNLAIVGDIDLESVADIFANLDLPADNISKIVDVMALAKQTMKTDLGMLGETMKYVAPKALEFGISIQDATAMAGILNNIGIEGSMAANAMNNFYNQLSSPSSEARKALEKLRIETRTATGELRPMTEILGELASKTNELGPKEMASIFSKVSGIGGGSADAFAKMFENGQLESFINNLKNSEGAAQRIADQMGDNLAGDIKKMSDAWKGFGITLHETNAKPLRDIISTITKLINKFEIFVKKHPNFAGNLYAIMVIMAGLVTAFGAIASAITGVIVPIVIIGFAVKSLSATALAALGIISLVIIGVAVAAFFIIKYWEPISNFFINIWERIKLAFSGGLMGILRLLVEWSPYNLIFNAWKVLLGKLGIDIKGSLFDVGKMALTGLIDGLKSFLPWLGDTVESIGNFIPDLFKKTLKIQSPSKIFMNIGGHITDGLNIGINRNAQSSFNTISNFGKMLPASVALASSSIPLANANSISTNNSQNPIVINYQNTGDVSININSNNSQEIIDQVKQILRERDLEAGRNIRSSLFDEEF